MSDERPPSNLAAAAVTLLLCGIGVLIGFVAAIIWAAWGGW